MSSIDPTKYEIETTTPNMWEREESFQEIMADQLRHAPWLMLSIVLHGLILLLVLLIPVQPTPEAKKPFTVNIPDKIDEIEEEEEEEEEIEEEEIEEEIVVEETEVTEVDEVTEVFDDVSEVKESAFDSDQWNSAVGLGGGAGGKYGGRGGGGKGGRRTVGKATARAIEAALEWLKNHQDDDGKWDADEFMRHDIEGAPCDGPGNPVHDVGLTGLALLAFLGDGSTMRSGAYKNVVKKGVKWLRSQQDPDSGLFGTASSNEFVYNHAIAAYAMTEAYGLSKYKLLRKSAQGGINYLERHRNPYSVWRYQPRDNDNDTSITGWCVMAYKSAEDFKLDVNKTALELSEAWFDGKTDPTNGRTGYTERGGPSSRKTGDHADEFPREKGECMTAVSLLCRFFLHHTPNEDPFMDLQADLILKAPPVWDESDGSIDHYYWYYATYALFQMGKRHWSQWSKLLEKAVVKPQRNDGNFRGSWDPVGAWGEDGGRVYSTAILCLTLEAHYRYSRLVR